MESTGEWCPYVTKLLSKGIIRSNATYSPDNRITRAELLKMTVIASGAMPAYDVDYTYGDIRATDWFAPYVSTAKKLGHISATNANFEPNRPITRAEAMKILLNFKGANTSFEPAYDKNYTYDDVWPTDWFAPYVSTAKKLGYISATNLDFRPQDPISRAEVAKIINTVFLQ